MELFNDSDTISRQAALDAFGLSEKTRKYGGDHSGYKTMMLYEIQNVIENLPSAQRWIPCSEKLPYAYGEYGEINNVLASCCHRNVEDGDFRWIKTLYFDGGNWCYPTGEAYEEKVCAWMPLPKLFKESE